MVCRVGRRPCCLAGARGARCGKGAVGGLVGWVLGFYVVHLRLQGFAWEPFP